eukprot:878042-Amorphochlora_amoeboformis.AAC.1
MSGEKCTDHLSPGGLCASIVSFVLDLWLSRAGLGRSQAHSRGLAQSPNVSTSALNARSCLQCLVLSVRSGCSGSLWLQWFGVVAVVWRGCNCLLW